MVSSYKNISFRFPFYYEAKTLFVIWLVAPATSGYSYMYRKLIHPELSKRESVGFLIIYFKGD